MSNKILFQSVCENYSDVTDITSPPARKYAKKYGFDYQLDVKPHRFYGRHNAWNKIYKIKELLKEKYEWIFCIDGDLLIYKFYKDIFDYVDKSKSLIMCSDGVADTLYNFNSGAMLFKNTEFSKKFIDDIINTTKEKFFYKRQWEQSVMQYHVRTNDKEFKDHIQICDSNDFNHNSKWVFHPADKYDKKDKIESLKKHWRCCRGTDI